MEMTKKSLGQHWLQAETALNYICASADLVQGDHVLEIGPGTGSLTEKLLASGARVVAVEKDETLARKLSNRLGDRTFYLKIGDILEFDLSQLPAGYKVVANIPYYLTSNLLRVLSEASNPPVLMVLLVQKEVAERIAADPGQMSLLALGVQLYYQPELGKVVPAKAFMPQPKVDSQVVILKRRQEPLFKDLDSRKFFQVAKAGFSERRKKMRSSLSGGLGISKEQADDLLKQAGIDSNTRAQELSLQQWHSLYQASTVQKSGLSGMQPE